MSPLTLGHSSSVEQHPFCIFPTFMHIVLDIKSLTFYLKYSFIQTTKAIDYHLLRLACKKGNPNTREGSKRSTRRRNTNHVLYTRKLKVPVPCWCRNMCPQPGSLTKKQNKNKWIVVRYKSIPPAQMPCPNAPCPNKRPIINCKRSFFSSIAQKQHTITRNNYYNNTQSSNTFT